MIDRAEKNVTMQMQMDVITKFLKRPENKDLLDKVIALQRARKSQELNDFTNQIVQLIESEGTEMKSFSYSDKQKAMYRTIGGTPHLDGAYTVFGEITEGLDVIDKIASVPTKAGDVPVDAIKMNIRIID